MLTYGSHPFIFPSILYNLNPQLADIRQEKSNHMLMLNSKDQGKWPHNMSALGLHAFLTDDVLAVENQLTSV